ncbi:MAG: DUF1080 domain-containing protein [Alphaproteobacteria bacterium]|nr:DUF1080 domain-containing protein [Alphaproteobacteria bacterium]
MQSVWMKLAALAALLGLSACVSAAMTEPTGGTGGWRPLFDGKTLDGWTPKIRGQALAENYRQTFSVKDGAIRVSYENYDQFGERFGHLFYKLPFSAYRLRLQYRFIGETPADTPGWARANSGVMIFAQDPATMALDASFPVSVEAQLLGPAGTTPRTNGNVCSPGTHIVMDGVLTTQHCINSQTPAPPNGDWAVFEIEVTGSGEVIQKIDGAVTISYSDVQLDPDGGMADSKPLVQAARGRLALDGGYISLQSEGAPIEFRNIEVLELE